MKKNMTIYILYLIAVLSSLSCHQTAVNPDPDENDTTGVKNIDQWLTNKDGSKLLERQSFMPKFNSPNNFYEFIEIRRGRKEGISS